MNITVEIIFTACLLSSPTACKTETMIFDAPVSNYEQCVLVSKYVSQKWEQKNPKYRIIANTSKGKCYPTWKV
jgi:hypothetical protein